MKQRPFRCCLHSLQGQSADTHHRIVVLNKSKSQMFFKSFERLFHITDPKYLIKFAPKNAVFIPGTPKFD